MAMQMQIQMCTEMKLVDPKNYTLEAALAALRKRGKLCEYYQAHTEVSVFGDYERYLTLPWNEAQPHLETARATAMEQIGLVAEYLVTNEGLQADNASDPILKTIALSDSSREVTKDGVTFTKVSFHWTLPYIKTTPATMQFIMDQADHQYGPCVKNPLQKYDKAELAFEDLYASRFMDLGVYPQFERDCSAFQHLLRAVNQTKPDGVPLKAVTQPLEFHVIQNVKHAKASLVLSADGLANLFPTIEPPSSAILDSVCKEELLQLAACMPADLAVEYFNWMTVGIALANACKAAGIARGDYIAAFHRFSEKAPQQYDPTSVQKKAEGFWRDARGLSGFGSIVHYARMTEEGRRVWADICRKREPCLFSDEDIAEGAAMVAAAAAANPPAEGYEGEPRVMAMLHEPLKAAGALKGIMCVDFKADQWYVCNDIGLWVPCGRATAACKLRDAIMDLHKRDASRAEDQAPTLLMSSEEIKKFLDGNYAERALQNFHHKVSDPRFPEKLDQLPRGVRAFSNGLFDAAKGYPNGFTSGFRPEDMVSRTTGYPLEAPSEEGLAFWREYYETMAPHDDRRKTLLYYFARTMYANSGCKFFLIVCDIVDASLEVLEGNSGKSWMLDAILQVIGDMSNGRQKDLWAVARNTGPNAHRANEVADAGMLLRCQDEVSKDSQLDMAKIRADAAGSTIAATSMRNAGAASMTKFIPKASNLMVANSKQLRAAFQAAGLQDDDGNMERIMVVVIEPRFLKPARLAEAIDKGVPHVHAQDETIAQKFIDYRCEHAIFLAEMFCEFPGDSKWERPAICEQDLLEMMKLDDLCQDAIRDVLQKNVAAVPIPPKGTIDMEEYGRHLTVSSIKSLVKREIAANREYSKYVTSKDVSGKQFDRRIMQVLNELFEGKFVLDEKWQPYVTVEGKRVQKCSRNVLLGIAEAFRCPVE
jgi:hypothetical protein